MTVSAEGARPEEEALLMELLVRFFQKIEGLGKSYLETCIASSPPPLLERMGTLSSSFRSLGM